MDDKLKKFAKYLSDYTAVRIENDIEVAWGYNIITRMDSALYDEFRQFKPIGRHIGMSMRVEYYIITKELTHNELVALLGAYTKEIRGSNGGFKEIVFGDKAFYSKWLASSTLDKRTIRLKKQVRGRAA